MMSPALPCAIYTRKSTEEHLDQAFNTLDAQREACSAYIASQRHEGWQENSTHYDDGGYSGGSMERPALKRLLSDVQSGLIKIVVVYKVDRLTRSLSDFARIVDIFDAAGASFVSVTQAFNTTTSMGRLTLNVLRSFAKFEREVTAERIRDKIAASKRKGMWMGGLVPLGYRSVDKALLPEPIEAGLVRDMFERYRALGSVYALQAALCEEGVVSRIRVSSKQGRPPRGGKAYSSGALYQILRNPIYRGEITHRGKRYPGRHEAIVEQCVFDEVQALLGSNGGGPRKSQRTASNRLLDGLLFDPDGRSLRATYATRKVKGETSTPTSKRYWYYATRRKADEQSKGPVVRVRADDIERLVCGALAKKLNNPEWVIESLCGTETPPEQRVKRAERASDLADALSTEGDSIRPRPECHTTIKRLLHRVIVGEGVLSIALRSEALTEAGSTSATVTFDVPVRLHQTAVNKPIILQAADEPYRDPDLIAMIADARRWAGSLLSGEVTSVKAMTDLEGQSSGAISRVLPLAWLAPDISAAILEGKQPDNLSASNLRKLDALPLFWDQQRKTLGFPTS